MAAYKFIIFGFFPLLAYGQTTEQQQYEEVPPQDANDLRWNVSSLEEFMSLLTINGRRLREDDIFSPHLTADGKRVITGGGLMATSDECSPRNMSVRLPLNFTNPQVAYYPECTMVQRCGGCCPTRFLSCVPAYKEKIVLKVLRAKFPFPGAMSMRWEGFESVEVERHLTCRAVCSLRPEDCGRNKRFLRHQCKCQCLHFQECMPYQRWDPEECRCRCLHNPVSCCDGEEETRCPFFFHEGTCSCTPKSMIGASIDTTQEEINEWLINNGYDNDLSGSMQVRMDSTTTPTTTTTTPTTTTTTTTTTTAPPAQRSGCRQYPCPRNFVWRMTSSGRCMCVLNRTRNRFPGRRRG